MRNRPPKSGAALISYSTQEFGLPRSQPLPCRTALALRTMPVAAAVIGDVGMIAVLASHDVAAELRRATALDCAHHLELGKAHMASVGGSPRGPVNAKNIRNF